ncbi:MAG: phage shock protein operon transcriptional activator [Gammaproteobacteria bacterium]|nr:phage shock protein operon transcriptional activator [Gammaproteobacteria bacterium]
MESRRPIDSVIGQSESFQQVMDHVSRVAPLSKPVLVIGERGTGKELVASRLHYLSSRWQQLQLKLNCAALPESLLETELFGHEAGAFTGATRTHKGRFERANGGSLFLDELASMSMRLQEKLLRVLEYGEFERIGGTQAIYSDVRLIGAANADLPSLAAKGQFREDLLDRLSFDVITLPPLRARIDDIPLLAEHFAMGMVKELRRDYFPGFSDEAIIQLQAYTWPGNVRELKNVVERAVYRTEPGDVVRTISFNPFDSPYRLHHDGFDPANKHQPAEKIAALASPTTSPYDFRQYIENEEISRLRQALEINRYHHRNTARFLGLSYNQFRSYFRKYQNRLTADNRD